MKVAVRVSLSRVNRLETGFFHSLLLAISLLLKVTILYSVLLFRSITKLVVVREIRRTALSIGYSQ